MKKNLLASYFDGIRDQEHGESYATILRYAIPEFITALLLYSLPYWLDSYFISFVDIANYATLGATSTLIHFITKVAEAVSVGGIIMAGQFNGQKRYKEVGRTLHDTFWVSVFVGAILTGLLYIGAPHIYVWYGVPQEMAALGVPYLRLRAVAIFLMFIYLAFVSFLRGIKNTKTPMKLFILGSVVFVLFDYLLILGQWGFPAMGLLGSAWASIIQYAVMTIAVLAYISLRAKNRKYGIQLLTTVVDRSYVKKLLLLSWPVLIDKATVAGAYMWLCKMLATMGTCSVATFTVIKDMERFALTPAVALAQVITFLVSNDYGVGNWSAIKANIKKVIFISSIMVLTILVVFSLWPTGIIHLFDKKGEFTDFAARAFPLVSILAYFDLLQLILSGALRGASNVVTVMLTRVAVCGGFFVPISYFLSQLPLQNPLLKFVLIYGSFYIGSALMSSVYVIRFRSEGWKKEDTSV